LDNGLILRQFEEIEQRIDGLMETLGSLEAANAELKDRTLQLEEALREKTAAENRYSEEKTEIKSRIDGLLKKLEVASER
jgi:chromosome segregation ATPase